MWEPSTNCQTNNDIHTPIAKPINNTDITSIDLEDENTPLLNRNSIE